jgi:predicted DNA-binding transcriptional regulator YafY
MLPKDRDYDKKIFRLLSILNKLDTGKKISTAQLAEEFNVSMRTIQRDLELLDMTGFPLVSLDKGQRSFMEGFSLKKAELSEEEASLLSFLYEIAKSLGKNFEDSFRGILRKVLAKDIESPFYAKIPVGVKLNQDFPFIKDLEIAIDESRKIELHYLTEGKEKWFRLEPLKIVFFDGFWYVVCRVDGKDWILKLRLENIRKLEVLDENFDAPENLKMMLDESINIWFSETRDKRVVLKISKDVAKFFKDKKYFPLQKIAKENKDGSLIVETTVCDYREIMPIILSWIPYVAVNSPKEFINQIDELLACYKKGCCK